MTMHNQSVTQGREVSKIVGNVGDSSVKSLANGIFEKLCREGCNTKDIISVSSQLLSLVTDEIHRKSNLG